MSASDPFGLIKKHITSVADFSDSDLERFCGNCHIKTFNKKDVLLRQNAKCKEIYFVNSGFLRLLLSAGESAEHTIYFVKPGFYVTEYASFLRNKPANYSIQAVLRSEIVVIPRFAVLDGYQNIKEGNKLGRIIAEDIFLKTHERMESRISKTPLERYADLLLDFPNIDQIAPQHMIASVIGVSPVHLSRLKASRLRKKHE